MHRIVLVVTILCSAATSAFAQDPVKVDPQHYRVEFENAKVRVLRVHYGPHEKSVMHSHPDAIATFLTGLNAKFTLPNGKSVERSSKSGETMWTPGEKHLPENLSDQPFDLILVELKTPRAAAKPATK